MTITLEPTAALDERSADIIFREARTAYSFTAEPVSDGQLVEIYELMKWAPTAVNSQPLRIVYVRSDEAKARLLPHLAEGNRRKSASAPVVAILAADTDFHEHLPRVAPQTEGARERLGANEANRAVMANNNAWLQAGGFILAVRAIGLDAGPMGGIDAAAIDAEFFPNSSLRTFLVVNIGRAADDGQFPRNPRLGFDEAITLV